jgi:hypothetical protein
MDEFARLRELVDRLIMGGPKASHVSASECHEINDDVHELLEENDSLRETAKRRLEDMELMSQELVAYRAECERIRPVFEAAAKWHEERLRPWTGDALIELEAEGQIMDELLEAIAAATAKDSNDE